jgi:hypothetical protein
LGEIRFYYNNYYENYIADYSIESLNIFFQYLTPTPLALSPAKSEGNLVSQQALSEYISKAPKSIINSNSVILNNDLPKTMDLTL